MCLPCKYQGLIMAFIPAAKSGVGAGKIHVYGETSSQKPFFFKNILFL